jgi:hypothetical protein
MISLSPCVIRQSEVFARVDAVDAATVRRVASEFGC